MMRLAKAISSLYSLAFPRTIVYMLQSTEYQPKPYLRWFWRTNNFRTVMTRRTLEPTRAARMLLLALHVGVGILFALAIILIVLGYWQFGVATLIVYPILLAHAVVVPLLMGRWLVAAPKERRLIRESEALFRKHPGEKIAVAGSYGKTSMKELLLTVLSTGDRPVAATPANKNVAISHAFFARKLTCKEAVVIIEYGEGAPGDVARFAATTHPTRAVITGIAPAHLDHYTSLAQAAEDIFSLNKVLPAEKISINGDSADALPYAVPGNQVYSAEKGAFGWKIGSIKLRIDGTSFTMKKGKKTIHIASGLLGRHQVGPLAFAAGLADELGLTTAQIEAGMAQTMPFEHRMQPYQLAGAWIIDDTYNGNIEGIRAGTALLKELDAKRKIYVTPGLVDQGNETERVHVLMGKLIAAASPDIVVLMRNSAMPYIRRGLEDAAYKGTLRIIDRPLDFYTNLKVTVAAGDLVLMQNDWTDNYN